MITNLMQRIYSAIDSEDTDTLNQIENNLEIAAEDGQIHTNRYDIVLDADKLIAYDKVSDESTEFTMTEDEILMNPVPKDLPMIPLNSKVTWRDELGNEWEGVLLSVNGNLATVEANGIQVSVDMMKLTKLEDDINDIDRKYSKLSTDTRKFFSETRSIKLAISKDYIARFVIDSKSVLKSVEYKKINEGTDKFIKVNSPMIGEVIKMNQLPELIKSTSVLSKLYDTEWFSDDPNIKKFSTATQNYIKYRTNKY